jgi:hypothetical protein
MHCLTCNGYHFVEITLMLIVCPPWVCSKEPLNPETVWKEREALKASMPRTTYFEGWTVDTLQQELPIWVLSLARAKDRRAAMIEELKAAGAQMQKMSLQLRYGDHKMRTTHVHDVSALTLSLSVMNPSWARHV